jgi:hypothetical protein
MKTFLMVFIVSILLGTAFAGSSYFVLREQDILFTCHTDTAETTAKKYNTYKQTDNGFPFSFSTKFSAPKSSGCQKLQDNALGESINGQGYDALGNKIAYSEINKQNFAKDAAIYSAVFFVLGVMLFGVKKKQ